METLTLTELAARLGARWRVLLTGALVVGVVATAVGVLMPSRYEAVAVVHVVAEDPSAPVDMAAEESVARSRRVVAEAVDALAPDGPSLAELESSVSATAVDGSTVLRVRVGAASPGAAARRADAVANAYLAVRAVDAAASRERRADRLARVVRRAAPAARDALLAEQARLAVLDPVTGDVVDPARVPSSAVGPGTAATALGGLVLGALLAAPFAARPGRTGAARAS